MSCKKCGSKMVIKNGKFGEFYGCSKFPDYKHMENLDPGDEDAHDDWGDRDII